MEDLNRRDDVDGILVQMPLPPQVDAKRILDAVDPAKDVDGFHPINVGRLVAGRPTLVACTPAGVMEIFRRSAIPLEGANAVVMGRSDIVGKPMALLLMHANATVTICHSKTRNLPEVIRRADIVVAAMGRAAMVTPDFVRPGATVIDVGTIASPIRRKPRIFREFSGAARGVPRKRHGSGGRRASGCCERCRSDHARAGRSGPAYDRHADEQHHKAARMRRGSRVAASAPRPRPATLMLRVGLTGGIASGKSTVAAMLREQDCPVLEADTLGHELLEQGQDAYNEVVREYGRECWTRTATWTAANWAQIIFADAQKRARLNQILHPRILDVARKWFAALAPGRAARNLQ